MEWKSDSNHPSKSSKRMGGGGGFQAPGKVLLLDLVLITQVCPHCENTSPTREKTDKRQMKVEPEDRRALSSRPRDLALVPCHKSATKGTFFKIIVGSYAIVRNYTYPPSSFLQCRHSPDQQCSLTTRKLTLIQSTPLIQISPIPQVLICVCTRVCVCA